jgi:hypothetical protein
MSKTTKIRPSPSIHASLQPVGTIKPGNDSNKWIVLANNSGIKKWIKLVSPIKKYQTHWNSAHPYLIIVAKNTIIILKPNINDYKLFDNFVIKIDNYKEIFPGTNTNKFAGPYTEKFTGSSILIHVKNNEYIFIGKDIYKFTSTNPISKYYSIMGNSDVPYPFAISKDKIYLMLENVYINFDDWDGKIDPYAIRYNFSKKYSNIKSIKYNVKYIDKTKY